MNGRIIDAAQMAALRHSGVFRKYTHRPYIEHPMRVAGLVSIQSGVSESMVCAAWLHDVVEDTCKPEERPLLFENIQYQFGMRTGELVEELTNAPKVEGEIREVRKKKDRLRLKNVSREAKLIKMIDRIDNLREMSRADDDLKATYIIESRLLLRVISDADHDDLANELFTECLRLAASIRKEYFRNRDTLYDWVINNIPLPVME